MLSEKDEHFGKKIEKMALASLTLPSLSPVAASKNPAAVYAALHSSPISVYAAIRNCKTQEKAVVKRRSTKPTKIISPTLDTSSSSSSVPLKKVALFLFLVCNFYFSCSFRCFGGF